jgi:hypothetical protein
VGNAGRIFWTFALVVLGLASLLLLRGRDETQGSALEARRAAASDERRPSTATLRPAAGRGLARREGPPTSWGAVRVVGRVVADAEPVAGSLVSVLLEGEPLDARATTGGDGTFALAVRLPPRARLAPAYVRAHDAATGGVGFARLGPPPDHLPPPSEVDVGTIRLGAALALDVSVHRGCEPRGPVVVTASPSGWDGPSPGAARAVASDDGTCRLEGLAPGTVRVVAAAEGCGRASVIAVLPREEAGPLRLTLGPERVVAVTVVEAGAVAPVARATLSVVEVFATGPDGFDSRSIPGTASLETDGSGRAEVRGLGAQDALWVHAQAPGFARSERVRVGAGETSARVELSRLRRMTWRIDPARSTPPPPEGTVLPLGRAPGGHLAEIPASARMEGGRVVADDWPPAHADAVATAPDGSTARLRSTKEAEAPDTWFLHPRSIEVLVRYPDGEPAAGIPIHVTTPGNNPLAAPVETDASGLARIDGLPEGTAQVAAFGPTMSTAGRAIGAVDLSRGGGRLEHVIERELRGELRVRLEGRPALPEAYAVSLGFSPVVVESADRARGVVRIRFRPGRRAFAAYPITIRARGWLDATADLPAPTTPDERTSAEVDLRPAGRVALTVVGGPRHYDLELQHEVPPPGDWVAVANSGVRNLGPEAAGARDLAIDAAGRAVRDCLEPGTYRFVETTSGFLGRTFRVAAGETSDVSVDLSSVGRVRGRVVVPPDEDARLAHVHRMDPPPGRWSGWPPIHVATDGTFSTLLPGTHAVTFEASHPLLRPAGEQGRATVTSPREEPTLRLERAALATLRLDGAPPRRQTSCPVRLFRGSTSGEPVASLVGRLDGERLRFGGFEPGTYTVWIDPGGRLEPVVLEDVALGPEDTDLGRVVTSPGRRVVVEVRPAPGAAAPFVQVHATHLGTPEYHRGGSSRDADPRVEGLGPGRFRVRVVVPSQVFLLEERAALEETVDLTRETEARLVLDLGKDASGQ